MLQGPGVKEPTPVVGAHRESKLELENKTFTCRDSLEPRIDKVFVPDNNRKIILKAQIHSHRAVIKGEFGAERQ